MDKDNNYIVVLSWMMTKLALSGNDLLCYALIYGYSQGGNGGYFGSRSDLAQALNIARRTATDILDRLLDKGHITMQHIVICGVQRCLYRAVAPSEATREKNPPAKRAAQQQNTTRPRFEKPSVDDVRNYCQQRGNNVDAERFIAYYEANGWVQGRGKPIRDWRAAVRTWENNNINRNNHDKNNATTDKESIIARRRAELARTILAENEAYCKRMADSPNTGSIFDGIQSGQSNRGG